MVCRFVLLLSVALNSGAAVFAGDHLDNLRKAEIASLELFLDDNRSCTRLAVELCSDLTDAWEAAYCGRDEEARCEEARRDPQATRELIAKLKAES